MKLISLINIKISNINTALQILDTSIVILNV